MHATNTVLSRYRRELCFHIDRQTNHFVLLRPTLQILAVIVQRRQNLARMDRLHQMIAAKRFAHQNPQIRLPRQFQHAVNATRRSAVFAEQLKVTGIRFGNEHLGSDICGLAAVLDFDGLREDLVFFAGAQKEGGALQRRIGECGHAEIVVLAFCDFGDGRQFELGEVSVRVGY